MSVRDRRRAAGAAPRRRTPLAERGYADLATRDAVTVAIDDWLRDEATLPEGSFVALAGDEIVGYSGLLPLGDDDAAPRTASPSSAA